MHPIIHTLLRTHTRTQTLTQAHKHTRTPHHTRIHTHTHHTHTNTHARARAHTQRPRHACVERAHGACAPSVTPLHSPSHAPSCLRSQPSPPPPIGLNSAASSTTGCQLARDIVQRGIPPFPMPFCTGSRRRTRRLAAAPAASRRVCERMYAARMRDPARRRLVHDPTSAVCFAHARVWTRSLILTPVLFKT